MAERQMTEKTLAIMKAHKADVEKKLAQMGGESTDGDSRAGYHDDAGFQNDVNRTRGELGRIGNIESVEIIEPRNETGDVGIGNKVTARFVEDSETETIYLLGEDDVIRRTDLAGTIVSAQSPLGKAILSKKQDETAEVKIGNSDKIHVKILKIERGDF